MSNLPEATKVPCNECPWRRDSWAGHLGPFEPAEWLAIVQSDEAIACHKTIEEEGNWDTPRIRQCAGAASYRANSFKSPRDPAVACGPTNPEVFARPAEFLPAVAHLGPDPRRHLHVRRVHRGG